MSPNDKSFIISHANKQGTRPKRQFWSWVTRKLENPNKYGNDYANDRGYLNFYTKSHYRTMVIIVLIWITTCLVLKFVIYNFPEMVKIEYQQESRKKYEENKKIH